MTTHITSETENDGAGRAEPHTPTPLSAGADWTSKDCGKVNGTASGPPLQPGGGLLAINGNTDLSSCVVGNSGARVYRIYLSRNPPPSIYEYLLEIEAQGPAGVGSGNMWLVFTDQSNDSYRLKIHSSTKKWHFISYNSKQPDLVRLTWNDSKP